MVADVIDFIIDASCLIFVLSHLGKVIVILLKMGTFYQLLCRIDVTLVLVFSENAIILLRMIICKCHLSTRT